MPSVLNQSPHVHHIFIYFQSFNLRHWSHHSIPNHDPPATSRMTQLTVRKEAHSARQPVRQLSLRVDPVAAAAEGEHLAAIPLNNGPGATNLHFPGSQHFSRDFFPNQSSGSRFCTNHFKGWILCPRWLIYVPFAHPFGVTNGGTSKELFDFGFSVHLFRFHSSSVTLK